MGNGVIRRLALFASAMSLAVAAAGLMNAQTPADQQKPTFKAGVNFVRVDVYPTLDGKVVGDLKQEEFEVLEDGVPQRIESFERIVVRVPGPEVERAEPRTVAEANRAAGDARNRLFVLFLDSYHSGADSTSTSLSFGAGTRSTRGVGRGDSRFGTALTSFLDRLIGEDDLVGVTRPELPANAITFTRRPSSFADFLTNSQLWQRLDSLDLDATERQYEMCYPTDRDLAAQMIARRRERMVLDSLRNLVRHLQGLREERKAILVVSQGWALYRPDRTMTATRDGVIPGTPPIGVVGGKPTFGDPHQVVSRSECDRDRRELAELDNEREFRTLMDDANRANASFYPIDPRGLAVFDDGPVRVADGAGLRDRGTGMSGSRLETLMTMAAATDGVASVNSNDFAKSLRRISDDLSAYYLLGYYSSNAKADGRFRKITVRVKRPNVSVRARRGYNAATEAELAATTASAAPVDPEVAARDAALSAVVVARADRAAYLAAGYRWESAAEGQPRPVVWVTGELDAAAARLPEWAAGAEATVTITSSTGYTSPPQTAKVAAVGRSFVMQFADPALKSGEYLVKLRLQGTAGADAGEQVRVSVPGSATGLAPAQPMLYRRGPYTGAGYQPTADTRFRKAERVRADLAVGAGDVVSARLLDRRGRPLPIPVVVAERHDGSVRFATAEVAVAPLAQGDYLVEMTVRRDAREEKRLVAFRVIT